MSLPTSLGLAVLAGMVAALSACGATTHRATGSSAATPVAFGTSTTSAVIPSGQALRGDGDADNPSDIDGNGDSDAASVGGADGDNDIPTRASYDFPDADDGPAFAFGHALHPAAAALIARVVKRFYAAIAADDGVAACSLFQPVFARLAAKTYGGPGGTPYLRGAETCAAIVARLRAHFETQLAETIEIVDVRVEGERAQAIFSSRKMPASSIQLSRYGSSWRISVLIGQPLA